MAGAVKTAEHRHSKRRVIQQGARIVLADGSLLGLCRISDVSASGACLEFDRTDAIPDHFILLLSYDGRLRRHCSVVWRSKNSIGVEFVRDVPTTASAKPQQSATSPGDSQTLPHDPAHQTEAQ